MKAIVGPGLMKARSMMLVGGGEVLAVICEITLNELMVFVGEVI